MVVRLRSCLLLCLKQKTISQVSKLVTWTCVFSCVLVVYLYIIFIAIFQFCSNPGAKLMQLIWTEVLRTNSNVQNFVSTQLRLLMVLRLPMQFVTLLLQFMMSECVWLLMSPPPFSLSNSFRFGVRPWFFSAAVAADRLPPTASGVGQHLLVFAEKTSGSHGSHTDWTSTWWQKDSSKMCHYNPVGSSSELKRRWIFFLTAKSGCVSWRNKQTFFALTPKNRPEMDFHSIQATKPTRSWNSFPSPWIWMSLLVTEG